MQSISLGAKLGATRFDSLVILRFVEIHCLVDHLDGVLWF